MENEMSKYRAGQTQEGIVNENLRLWAGTNRGRVCRLTAVGVFVASMAYEWGSGPNGGPLLGPLGLIWYGGLSAGSFVLCAISVTLLIAFLIKPHIATAVISILGAINWLFWGMAVLGIGC
jgi:hypothetical protein